jgi:succinate dehydrogenase/fumarate reductase flavoprotein subunit
LGSVWGMLYQGGGNIAECIAFGRIAGANAAAEKAW